MKRVSLSFLASGLWILISPSAHALIDTNTNGLSDLWEKAFNGNALFSSSNPAHAPTADPDGDGWTNLFEAAAGTNPFDPNIPGGLVRPDISHTPGTYEQSDTLTPAPTEPSLILIDPPTVTLTWPTIAGKAYQVFLSENLTDWSPTSGAFMGDGIPLSFASENIHPDGTVPAKLFMRIAISDTDSDSDSLTDWEEGILTLDPFSPDTDRDGIPDGIDSAPKTSATLADPDGLGLANANLLADLKANWTFEESTIPVANLFGKNEARCENMAPTTTPSWPVLVPFSNSGTPAFLRRGFVSRGISLGDKSIFGDGKIFTGITNSFTLSFWHRFEKDSIKNGNAIYKCLWSLSDCRPSQSLIKSNTLAIRRKSATEEEIYLGAYTWTSGGGNPDSTILGKTFTRPLGTADDGKWHHYTIIRTAGKYTLYIDGAVMPGLNDVATPWLTIPLNKPTPTSTTDYDYDWNTFGRMAPSLPQNQTIGTFDRIRLWSRPLNSTESTALHREDLDGDDLWDVTENTTAIWHDIDLDNNREEGEYGFVSSPFVWENTARDTDGDSLTDLAEQDTHHTDIAHPDTDGDLLPDGWEIQHSLNPLNATGNNGQTGNPDNDNLDNLGEYSFVSNPHLADTDGDGTPDGAEVAAGSNPSDASDNGQPLPVDQRVSILLGIGDQSGSDSEDYNLNIYRIDPSTGAEIRFHTHRSGGHGSYLELPRHFFRKGETYTYQIDWQSSTQGSASQDPNTPPKGPDYDYTLKVQPQTAYLGKLYPSYHPATGATNGTSLTAIGANNVAATQQQFEENYESRRVALVAPKLEWQAIAGFENLDTHIDPWTNTAKGKRIFPCRKNPNDKQLRHKLKLVATGGLKGVEVFVKSFDIDDSTSEDFDLDANGEAPVIDPYVNGSDNDPDDFLNTEFNGHFWDDPTKKWGGNEAVKKFGANGKVDFDFRVGMQPGDNYRAVASIGGIQGYAEVQTDNPAAGTYIGHELAQTGGAIASERLTVWRRLWVENDSMATIGTYQSGYKKNDLSWDLGTVNNIGYVTFDSAQNRTTFGIPKITDSGSFGDLQNGSFIIQGVSHPVVGTLIHNTNPVEGTETIYDVTITGNLSGTAMGSGFRLYDDDNIGLVNPPLPRTDLVNEQLKTYFRPSFIEVMDAAAYNSPIPLPYKLNEDVSELNANTIIDDLMSLRDANSCWVCPVTTAYQGRQDEDGDGEEGYALGETAPHGSFTSSSYYDHSTVFVEACRENFAGPLTATNADALNNARIRLGKWITAAISHEMGHQPANQEDDHPEGGLMSARMDEVSVTSPENAIFNPVTVLRFRNANRWSK